MFTSSFWLSAVERAVKSFAQSLVALLGVGGLGLLDAPWPTLLSTAGMASLLSVLTSIASERVGPDHDPSLVSTTPAAKPVRGDLAGAGPLPAG